MRTRNLELGTRNFGQEFFRSSEFKVPSSALILWLCVSIAFGGDAPRPVEPPAGTLFICGGGKLPDRVYDEFVTAAGGEKARLVVVPTASEAAESFLAGDAAGDRLLERWRSRSVAEVRLLHARTREEANDEAFVQPLREATGVWLEEGWQSRLADAYCDTKVLDALQGVLARGGVVGGTSAGAAVMTDPMIAGDSTTEKGRPQLARGFGLLPGAIVDQHFLVRGRESRLKAAVAQDPRRVGFGVDEGTALVVRGRELAVIGESSVTVLIDPTGRKPLHARLTDGAREDLIALSRAAIDRLGEPFPPAKPAAPIVPHGSLVIVGGGKLPEDVQQKFVELAGGPQARIIVVTAASDRPQTSGDVPWLKKAGVPNAVVLHPRNRAEADDPKFVAKLSDATGIWFGGGRQWRTVDLFEGTACYDAFHDVLKRGGVIGGSSAGATIQGEYLVRGSPVVNTIMMAPGYERGFSFLPGTAIDQHFTQRKRQPDMERLKRTYPQLLGIGLDEGTAILVRGTTCEVMGEGTVSIYPPGKSDPPRVDIVPTGKSYNLSGFRPN